MKIAKLCTKPEIFYSIQGEGRTSGRPSVFIRSSLCNLHCVWCDTDYTWNWQNIPTHNTLGVLNHDKYTQQEQIITISAKQVAEDACRYSCKNLVLTGGEPLLQQEDWVSVMQLIKEKIPDCFFEVETNGTLMPIPKFNELVNYYNVSPKLEHSGNDVGLRENPAVYSFFSDNSKAIFKYVVITQQDVNEILTLVKKYRICHDKVYLMPEGITGEKLRTKQIWVIEMCKQYGFNFTDRLHIHLYGARRGV